MLEVCHFSTKDSHVVSVFTKGALKTEMNQVNKCSDCMFKWVNKGHFLNNCRRGFYRDPTGKLSWWNQKRAIVGSLMQRSVGTSVPKGVLDCYEDKLNKLMKGDFQKELLSNHKKCQAQCSMFSQSSPGGTTEAEQNNTTGEKGLKDVLIPTLAHKIVERQRRTEIASAFI
jgi:hypothetical protein